MPASFFANCSYSSDKSRWLGTRICTQVPSLQNPASIQEETQMSTSAPQLRPNGSCSLPGAMFPRWCWRPRYSTASSMCSTAGPKTLNETAAATGASERGLRSIMNVLVGFNFLAKADGAAIRAHARERDLPRQHQAQLSGRPPQTRQRAADAKLAPVE